MQVNTFLRKRIYRFMRNKYLRDLFNAHIYQELSVFVQYNIEFVY